MSYRFYKTNKNVIEFDCKGEIHKIIFNHYIMRKVNLHRMKGDLPNGQFKITVRGAACDLGLSKSTISRLLNEFQNRNIISIVKKSSASKSSSIYEYITEPQSQTMQKNSPLIETVCETIDGTVKVSDFEDFSNVDNSICGTKENTMCETFNIKYINKELNKNNIYSRIVEYLNKKSGKNFKSTTPKTRASIIARLNENFVEDDFYKVIDIKCSQWKGSDMEMFLRPQTLFSNKFESYLNEKANVGVDQIETATPYKIDFKF
ncbi:MAG: conserved phage C-terminal domain-containing protein [Romboutsia sp.]